MDTDFEDDEKNEKEFLEFLESFVKQNINTPKPVKVVMVREELEEFINVKTGARIIVNKN